MAEDDAVQDVLMVLLPKRYDLVEGIEEHGATVRTSDGLFKLVNGIRDDGVPDVVHLHFLHGFFVVDSALITAALGVKLLAELFLMRALGVPVVWTVHNLTGHESPHPRLEYLFRHLAAHMCDRIIVHCDDAGDIITSAYRLPSGVQDRIRTIPHGNYEGLYPDTVSKRAARSHLGLEDEFVYLFFGYIRPYKQVDYLIRTFQRLRGDDVRLFVVGNPDSDTIEKQLKSLAELDDRVRTVFEFVPDEEVQYYFRAADVAVFPFRSTLTSGSTILAMTFGRPVIAPNLGCVKELLDEAGGFPYDPTTEEALFKMMRHARSTPLDGMGTHNHEVVADLDWNTLARRTLRLYGRAAGTDVSQ